MSWSLPQDSAIALLGVAQKEDCISRVIVGALAQASFDQRCVFLEILAPAATLPLDNHSWAGASQVSVPNGRIDMVFAWRVSDETAEILVIEHKIHAGETPDQTRRYATSEVTQVLRNVAAEKLGGVSIAKWRPMRYAYLTLFDEPAGSMAFAHHVLHSQLVRWFATFERDDGNAAALIADWGRLVATFDRRALSGNTLPLATALLGHEDDPLNARFRVFEALGVEVAEAARLEWHGCYRSSPSGRSWYGCHLTKPGWMPPTPLAMRDDWHTHFRPDRDFWVHFQLHYAVLAADEADAAGDDCTRLKLLLNYETLPYVTQPEFNEHVRPDESDAYRARRRAFYADADLRASLMANQWRFAGRWNQVAVRQLQFTADTSWSDGVVAISDALRKSTNAVAAAVHRHALF